jgi:selenocysteine lyase/cysteine desulfurase
MAFSDVSNTTGLRMPTKELCRLAAGRGIYTHVDGAQTFGAGQIALHDLGCDSYAGSAHKWFMGPKEVGVLYLRKERLGIGRITERKLEQTAWVDHRQPVRRR